LESVYCPAIVPPTAKYWSDYQQYAFHDNAQGRKIYVPAESVEAYKSASGWSYYADAIEGMNF
jgi:peptide methionine sulfoxide reductase MsrB